MITLFKVFVRHYLFQRNKNPIFMQS